MIAEVKRASPSRGVLNASLDPRERARAYAAGGARAVSVLTAPEQFGGSNDDLRAVRESVELPVLKKDFHIDTAQVWEARALGASALLLIARALGPDDLDRLYDAAREADIEAVVEVRDEWELDWVVEVGAQLIGVNKRNLETLVMEDDVPGRLLPRIPNELLAIAESGVVNRTNVEELAELGADAVLVGSSLSLADDSEGAVRELTGVSRRSRDA